MPMPWRPSAWATAGTVGWSWSIAAVRFGSIAMARLLSIAPDVPPPDAQTSEKALRVRECLDQPEDQPELTTRQAIRRCVALEKLVRLEQPGVGI